MKEIVNYYQEPGTITSQTLKNKTGRNDKIIGNFGYLLTTLGIATAISGYSILNSQRRPPPGLELNFTSVFNQPYTDKGKYVVVPYGDQMIVSCKTPRLFSSAKLEIDGKTTISKSPFTDTLSTSQFPANDLTTPAAITCSQGRNEIKRVVVFGNPTSALSIPSDKY